MAGKGFSDADQQAPLYLRTTEEMLEEFAYLGSEKAYEVVIANTNKIANMIEKISPVRPDKCPPVIENSDQLLTDICYSKAYSMYGDPLPEIVEERLKRELNSIISNGFAVMYIIAQKLVWKSNEDGYLVGSRGSVGSSFVATMSGITEVNPLSPHYYCKKCHYSDFTSEEVRKYAGGCGHDMPDKLCPVCGEKLVKDGFEEQILLSGDTARRSYCTRYGWGPGLSYPLKWFIPQLKDMAAQQGLDGDKLVHKFYFENPIRCMAFGK